MAVLNSVVVYLDKQTDWLPHLMYGRYLCTWTLFYDIPLFLSSSPLLHPHTTTGLVVSQLSACSVPKQALSYVISFSLGSFRFHLDLNMQSNRTGCTSGLNKVAELLLGSSPAMTYFLRIPALHSFINVSWSFEWALLTALSPWHQQQLQKSCVLWGWAAS